MSKLGSGDSIVLTEAYECDYERNCTPLYKAIETAEDEDEYEAILDFLESGEWSGPFEGIGGPSPLEQVKTWVTRFDPNDETKVKWSQLPLHLAIVCGAPAQIVASLVKLYPEALRCTDDQHMLPLHLALRHESDDEVVAFLLIQFPESVNARGKNGRTAVECALRAKDKLRGIILEIVTDKTAQKIATQMSKEKKELQNELENRTTELLSTVAALEDKTKELENLSSAAANRAIGLEDVPDTVLEKVRAEVESEWKDKAEKLKSEKLLQEVIAQKKIDQLLSLVREKDAAEKKARAEEIAIKKELEVVQGRVAQSASPSDWKAVKQEVENLKVTRLEKTRSETKSTINSLKGELEKSIDEKSDLKSEMKQLKNIVEKLQATESTAKTASELTSLRNEVDVLRAELKERAASKQTKVELSVMKKLMERELRNAEGKTHEELAVLRRAVESANASDLEKKTVQELNAMKEEFETLKREMKEKELATQTKQDVEDLRATLEREMTNADSKTKSELSDMKQMVESLQATLVSNRSTDDMLLIKQEVETLKDDFKKKETASKIKLEAAILKKMVEAELKQSEGKTQNELVQMKQAIKELAAQAHGNRDVDELAKVRLELQTVKSELKEVEKISKTQQELQVLKTSLEREIVNTKGKTEEDLLALKTALDSLNNDHIESREIKKTLEAEIRNASGKTQEELKQLKKSIDSIDLRKLETKNQKEWETIRKEMDVLTAYLKKRQHDGVGETHKELLKVKEAVAAIDLNRIESTHRTEFESLRAEMEQMKNEMKQKELEESNLKKQLSEIKTETQMKKRKGLKAFFFNRHFIGGEKSLFSKSRPNPKASVATDKEDAKDEVVTIMPPRGARSVASKTDVHDTSDDNSLSGPLRDLEESRREKANWMLSSKSRDAGDVISLRSVKSNKTAPAKYHSSLKQQPSLELKRVKSRSIVSYSKDDIPDDEEVSLKILSLSHSHSLDGHEEIQPVVEQRAPPSPKKTTVETSSPSPATGFFSLKKAKSDIGRLISKPPKPVAKTTVQDDEARDEPEASIASASTTKASSLKGSRATLALRKSKSMDVKKTIVDDELEETYSVIRTKSKPVVGESGEVEMHELDEETDDEDMLIQPRVSFVTHLDDSTY